MNDIFWYSIGVFIVVLISGCIVNLLKKHYVIQLAGIALFFTYAIFGVLRAIRDEQYLQLRDTYFIILPSLTGISACLISMVLGFWIFPLVRRRMKD